jgi:hypothetical protein
MYTHASLRANTEYRSDHDTQQNTPDVQDDYDTLFPIFAAIAYGVANARYVAYSNDYTCIEHY